MIHRLSAAWSAFRNPPPRWTMKDDGPVRAITPDVVSRDDAAAIMVAIQREARRRGTRTW